MPPYRPRLRSQTGCLRCKERRKKCDERKPICDQCERLRYRCVYHDGTHATLSTIPPESSTTSLPGQGLVIHEISRSLGQDYTQEIQGMLHYYDQQKKGSWISLLVSHVVQHLKATPPSMLVAAVALLLTVHMPFDWSHRSSLLSRFSTDAAQGVLAVMKESVDPSLLDTALTSSCHLYLYDLHSYPESSRRWFHIHEVNALLKKRLSITGGPVMSCEALGPFILHMACSSTVHFRLIPQGLTPSNMDSLIDFVQSRAEGINSAKPPFHGIPKLCISLIFRLAYVRKEMLQTTISDEMISLVTESLEQLKDIPPSPLDRHRTFQILYIHACYLLQHFLFCAAKMYNKNVDLVPRQFIAYSREELDTALTKALSHDFGMVTVLWPVLIIGLASTGDAIRTRIRLALLDAANVTNLCAARGILQTLEFAWDTGIGISVLMTTRHDGTLML